MPAQVRLTPNRERGGFPGGDGERRARGGEGVERRGPPGGERAPGGAGPQTVVSIDPVTYAVLDKGPPPTAMLRMVHQLHGSFLIPGVGRQLVGWAGALMLIMGLSGIVLWWPKKGQWLRAFTVKTNAPTYRFNRDLHGAVGVWLWAVFIVVTFTGVYISFPALHARGRPRRKPADRFRRRLRRRAQGGAGRQANLDRAARARQSADAGDAGAARLAGRRAFRLGVPRSRGWARA
jgi:hypothetical protein